MEQDSQNLPEERPLAEISDSQLKWNLQTLHDSLEHFESMYMRAMSLNLPEAEECAHHLTNIIDAKRVEISLCTQEIQYREDNNIIIKRTESSLEEYRKIYSSYIEYASDEDIQKTIDAFTGFLEKSLSSRESFKNSIRACRQVFDFATMEESQSLMLRNERDIRSYELVIQILQKELARRSTFTYKILKRIRGWLGK